MKQWLFCLGVVLLLPLLPLIMLWTFLGWIFTASPRVCAVITLTLSTYLTGLASLYHYNPFLLFQYFSFLLLFLYCFVYRSTTRIFRFSFLSLILLSQSLLFFFLSQPISPFRVFLASSLTFSSSLTIVIVLLNLWLPASEVDYLRAEDLFLQSRCNRKLNKMLVASLGTIEVTDEFTSPAVSPLTPNRLSKPILVLLHGYGGCNAQWVECLSRLQSRFISLSLSLPSYLSHILCIGFKSIVWSSMGSVEVLVSDGAGDGKGIRWKAL
jgi:hypothetical protein